MIKDLGYGASLQGNYFNYNEHAIHFKELKASYTYNLHNTMVRNTHGISARLTPDPNNAPNEKLTITNQDVGDFSGNTYAIYADRSIVEISNSIIQGEIIDGLVHKNHYAVWGKRSEVVIKSSDILSNVNGILLEGAYTESGLIAYSWIGLNTTIIGPSDMTI